MYRTILFNYIFQVDRKIFREVLILGFPIILSNISRVLMGLADTMMVGRINFNALAGVGMGSIILWTIVSIGISLRTATQTVASRRLGQKKFNECSTSMYNIQFVSFLMGIPISICIYLNAELIAELFIDDPNVLPLCIDYVKYGSIGIYFNLAYFVFVGFFIGIEKSSIHMICTILSNIMNVYLNCGLIFGIKKIDFFFNSLDLGYLSILWSWYPFPELGVKGAAIATTIASIFSVLISVLYLFTPGIKTKFQAHIPKLNWNMLKTQIQLAYPMFFQELSGSFVFALIYKLFALIVTIELAVSQIILQVMHASFMPAVGLGQACSTLVGKYLGKKNLHAAKISMIESLRGSLIIMGTMGVIFILFPKYIISLFTYQQELIDSGYFILQFVGGVQIIDAIGITLWFGLNGAGDTFFPAVILFLLQWIIILPIGYLVGIYYKFGIIGPWLAMAIEITLFAIIISYRVQSGQWKLKNV